jgi:hypothetical protein
VQAVFTVGGTPATLGDDAARHTIELEQLGGEALEQVEALLRGANPARFARGNVAGDCVFSAGKSHATRAAAIAFFLAEYARLNTQGSLVITEGSATLTLANAICRGVMVARINGLRWTLRYTFGITTIT